MRRKRTAQLALAAVLCALAVTVMMLGGLIPAATFCCPMLAGFLTIPILCECGAGMALCAWAAISILSCLLGPDKEAAAIYLFLGWYPVLRPKLEKLRQPLRFLLKLLIFNCAVFAVYSLLLFVLGLESLRAEFSDMGKIMLLVTLVLGNGIFILFDFVLPRLELLYRCRFRPHLWR
ncbi:MAG: hypothetical protein E7424_00370 [Ruminococcaceae bacterium]|jgi:hypothetical protein|nr:hypothetical protein [Oscillospiraceae bacterium]